MVQRLRRLAPTLVVAFLIGGGTAHAQGGRSAQAAQARADQMRAPPAPGFAAILGLVDDSLRGRPLVGARVMLLGSTLSGITGPDGIFRIDSLPPGEAVLFVKHPFLDTLFVTVVSPKLNLVAGKLEQVFITSPALDRVRERICPRAGAAAGIAILAGRVDNADTDQPVANAVVSLVYTDPGAGTTAQKLRTVRTRNDGFYVICGLPETFTGAVQASLGAVSSSEITIEHKSDLLATASFILGSSAKADSGRRGNSVLRGRVTDVTGRPLSGVQVAVEGGNQIATSGADGLFTLEGLASGTTNAVIRKIGFSPAYRTVHLRGTQPQSVSVALTEGARTLATVNVTAPLDPALKKVGFTDRRMMGLRSNFLLPEDIAKRMAGRTTDLFRNMTGFRVNTIGTGAIVESTRMSPGTSGCVSIFVDRIAFEQMAPGDLDQAYPVHHIAAVEGYASATDTPAEFRMSGKGCATIVLWTKYKLSKP